MIPPNIHVHAYKYTHIHIHDTVGVHLWTCKQTLSCSSNTFTVYIVYNHANICHCLQIHTCNLHLLVHKLHPNIHVHVCTVIVINLDQLASSPSPCVCFSLAIYTCKYWGLIVKRFIVTVVLGFQSSTCTLLWCYRKVWWLQTIGGIASIIIMQGESLQPISQWASWKQ